MLAGVYGCEDCRRDIDFLFLEYYGMYESAESRKQKKEKAWERISPHINGPEACPDCSDYYYEKNPIAKGIYLA